MICIVLCEENQGTDYTVSVVPCLGEKRHLALPSISGNNEDILMIFWHKENKKMLNLIFLKLSATLYNII